MRQRARFLHYAGFQKHFLDRRAVGTDKEEPGCLGRRRTDAVSAHTTRSAKTARPFTRAISSRPGTRPRQSCRYPADGDKPNYIASAPLPRDLADQQLLESIRERPR